DHRSRRMFRVRDDKMDVGVLLELVLDEASANAVGGSFDADATGAETGGRLLAKRGHGRWLLGKLIVPAAGSVSVLTSQRSVPHAAVCVTPARPTPVVERR